MVHASFVRQGMFALCAAWLLLGATARADQFVIGKAQSGSALRIYVKSSSGCSSSAVSRASDGHALVFGTPGDDIIVVHDTGVSITWCGLTIRSLDGGSERFTIFAEAGSDIVWGGARAADPVHQIWGAGSGPFEDHKPDFIYAGSARVVGGGQGGDAFFVNQAGTRAYANAGDDLFCTQVDGVYMNMHASRVVGDYGTDGLYGPVALVETTVEHTNTEGDRQRCNLGYVSILGQVLAMLSVQGS